MGPGVDNNVGGASIDRPPCRAADHHGVTIAATVLMGPPSGASTTKAHVVSPACAARLKTSSSTRAHIHQRQSGVVSYVLSV